MVDDMTRKIPKAWPYHGYTYELLYVSGVYCITEIRKRPCKENRSDTISKRSRVRDQISFFKNPVQITVFIYLS